MTNSKNHVALFAKGSLGLSLVLFLVAAVPVVARRARTTIDARSPEPRATTSGRIAKGTEVIAFFIASSGCGASQHPKLPSALARIRTNLGAQAHGEGKRFVYAGVAVDENPQTGLNFLKPFGPFDEVMSGGGWVGSGSIEFMVRGLPGALALPQLLVIERDVSPENGQIVVSSDRIVRRVLGFVEIFRLAGLSDSGGVSR
jgi:hypothetical protein